MSCIIVTLHVPVYFVINNASIRLYQPNFKIHDVHMLWLTGSVIFSYTVWYWKRVVPIAIIRRKFSADKLNSPSRLSTNYRNTGFWRLETGTRVADVPRSFGCNEQTIYRLQTRFRQPGSKNYKPPPGRPRITTPHEVRVIVRSTWRHCFMATWILLKHLRHATGTRISVYTARNRLRGDRMIFWVLEFEFWYWPFCVILIKKRCILSECLLRMFTFVRN